jgi:pyruvate dehydrogenase E2 component (dihydrolipoamide acetyltransferase)
MASSIIMPKTGMAMEEGTIIRWLKAEGDSVHKGEAVAEIETDKSTMELEAEADGVLLRIVHTDGQTVPVAQVIGWIGKPGEAIAQEPPSVPAPQEQSRVAQPSETLLDGAAGGLPSGKVAATPAARRVAAENKINLASVAPTGGHGEVRQRDVQAAAQSLAVSPLAKKIAAQSGIALGGLKGSGPGGRITTADLPLAPSGSASPGAQGRERRLALTPIQKTTGKRLLQSHTEIPCVTCQAKADVSELLSVREHLNAALSGTEQAAKTTINDWVLKAVAKALQANPRLNSVLDGGELVYRLDIDIGMAVATPRGLLVPVLRAVDSLSLGQVALRSRELSVRAKEGKLSARELEAGTFTVSNLGMYGISSFTPIINQPQVAILGVCAIEQELHMIDTQVKARSVMGLSLTFDHRALDGVEAALFLKSLRELLENPLMILY